MTARARVLSAALLRAGLLAAVLAIVAGIFGMHVMTADHSSHTGHAGTVKAQSAYPAGGQPAGDAAVGDAAVGRSHAGHAAGHTAVVHPDAGQAFASAGYQAVSAPFSAAESCGSGCPGAQEAGAPCIPLAKTASLALVPPQAGTAGPVPAGNTGEAVGYSFIPPSPTPCELSISRT
ncbi:MAG TPA: hypothetical protein VFS79_04965 [Arthrobacter sp.]|nr:hypothetical protein [Arthrobacter sp.]